MPTETDLPMVDSPARYTSGGTWVPPPRTPGESPTGESPTGADAAAAVASTAARGARVAVVVIALVWHSVIALPAVLSARADLARPTLVLLCWAVVAVIGMTAGTRLLRGRPLPAWPLVVPLLVIDALVFAAAGERQLFTAANWVWSTLAWFFVLVLWGRRVTGLLVLLAAHSAIALVALLGHGATAPADLARFAMYVYGTASLPVAIFAGGTAISALARSRADTAATANALLTERDAAERARYARQAQLSLASGTADEVLAALADGRADPADPAVRRRCALAAARLRRLIAESDDVPDPLLHELRAAADLAERRGVPIDLVTIGTPPPLPVAVRRALADPLTAILADTRDRARLTVVAGPDEVAVSLVVPDTGYDPTGVDGGSPDHSGDPRVEHLQERDGEIRWTQTRWRR